MNQYRRRQITKAHMHKISLFQEIYDIFVSSQTRIIDAISLASHRASSFSLLYTEYLLMMKRLSHFTPFLFLMIEMKYWWHLFLEIIINKKPALLLTWIGRQNDYFIKEYITDRLVNKVFLPLRPHRQSSMAFLKNEAEISGGMFDMPPQRENYIGLR